MNKAPAWFSVIAVIALLWNLVGAAAVIMNFMMTPETLASLAPEQQQLYADTPLWSSIGSLLAVTAGSLACLGLLMKKRWAYILFVLSIAGLVVQNIGIFVVVDALAILGQTVLFMQALVAILAVAQLFLAKHALKKGWIT